ncbi:hypothetical protein FRB99_007155 [Tulasnella sp. 403]|nr:hypothetical protein FRB99_007155 [Tulasnella sp. 403]
MGEFLFSKGLKGWENYSTWAKNMCAIFGLKDVDLWSHISSLSKKPTDTTLGLNNWLIKDSQVVNIIILSINNICKMHIDFNITSKECWDMLKHLYAPKGPVNVFTMFKDLMFFQISMP